MQSTAPCRYGAACFNYDPEHRARFSHPATSSGGEFRRACKYGARCYQRSTAHLEQFAHPGDRNYRIGMVLFGADQQPEFESVWQLFQYHDPDESGHLSREEFEDAFASCEQLAPGCLPKTAEQAWEDVGGPLHGYVNFRQFVAWTQDSLHLEYPVGLEGEASTSRPCRFGTGSGFCCSCPSFEPAEASGMLCKCGHKKSMHRSDFAQRTFTKFLESATNSHWASGDEGLVEIEDPDLLQKLQDILTASHKTSDNWTRDRGCLLHGVNGCPPMCASKNRARVPRGYVLVTAFRNQNQDLWSKFTLYKSAIAEEVARDVGGVQHEIKEVATRGHDLETPLDTACNEWYLFHGSSAAKCKMICSTNFKLALAGLGATWKDPGAAKGTPLYGFGIYFAERITKSDEYAEPVPGDDPVLGRAPGGEALHACLLCRVLGGRANTVTTNEIEIDKLRKDVFDGPYHSVFGDRVASLGKPYREVVVYDKDQCYPEYLLVYARSFN